MSNGELLTALQQNGIQLNETARALFTHQGFKTSGVRSMIEIAVVSVGELGHTRGATLAQVFEHAATHALAICPLELAVHLRLNVTGFALPPRGVSLPFTPS